MKLRLSAVLIALMSSSLMFAAALGQAKQKQKTPAASAVAADATKSSLEGSYSGMYSFLKEGEFVQLSIEQGQLSGFVSRMGDLDSDRGVFLDQFFDKAKIKGNQVSFVTKPVHGTWFEFDGHVERGPAKTLKEEGYWLLTGTLKEYTSDVERKVSARSRQVNLKSFPQDDDTGDEEQIPPDKK
jgi:hypothetical protein